MILSALFMLIGERKPMQTGDRVRYRNEYLEQARLTTSLPAPTDTGRFARGEVLEVDKVRTSRRHLPAPNIVTVRWDNGKIHHVIAPNLEITE